MHEPELLLISVFVKWHSPPKIPDEEQDTAYKRNRKHNQVATEKALQCRRNGEQKTEAEGEGYE